MQSAIDLEKHLRRAKEMLVKVTQEQGRISEALLPDLRNYFQIFQKIDRSDQQQREISKVRSILDFYQILIALQQQFIERYIMRKEEKQQKESKLEKVLIKGNSIHHFDTDSKKQRSTEIQSEIVGTYKEKLSQKDSLSRITAMPNYVQQYNEQKYSSSQSSLLSNLDRQSQNSGNTSQIYKTCPINKTEPMASPKNYANIEETNAIVVNAMKNIQEIEFQRHFSGEGPKMYISNHQLHSKQPRAPLPQVDIAWFSSLTTSELQKITKYNYQVKRISQSLIDEIDQLNDEIGDLKKENNQLANMKKLWSTKYSKAQIQLKQLKNAQENKISSSPLIIEQVKRENSLEGVVYGLLKAGKNLNIGKDHGYDVPKGLRDGRSRGVILEGDDSVFEQYAES